jgi:anti-sigma factor RsiW
MTTDDRFTTRLSELIDDELPPADRAELEAHLASCGGCRTLLDELRAVRRRAAALPDSPPAADLWPGVAARIAGGRAAALPYRPRRTFSFTLPQLVAAGLALMILSGSMVWLARLGGDRTDFPAVDATSQAPGVAPVNFANEQYDRAVADLQAILEAGRANLDPQTVQVLESNLDAIDRAIDQCRRALADDPGNQYLNVHLADARKRKLALLREAAGLAGS